MSQTVNVSAEDLAALRIDRSRRRRRISPWVWVALAAVLTVAVLSPRLLRKLLVAEVSVAQAERLSAGKTGDGSPELTAAGYVVADREAVLAAKFTGRLVKLYVAESQHVEERQLLAELDHDEIDASIVQAKAEVVAADAEIERLARLAAQAEAELAAARTALETFDAENKQYEILLADAHRRLQRDKKLAESSAIGFTEVDDRQTEVWGMEAKIAWTGRRRREAELRVKVAETQAAAAKAAVAAAKARQRSADARVDVLDKQREECFIRSPFQGVVTDKTAEVGEIIAPFGVTGSKALGSIVTIADWASLQAEVDVAEMQIGRVREKQRAAITIDAIPGRVFPGRVCRILPRADRSKATVKVRVDFVSRDEKAVLPEMGVRVKFLSDDAPPGIETGAVRDVVRVPAAAVQSGDEGPFVWVVSDETARKQTVQVGKTEGEKIEIREGLSGGEKVVVGGIGRLRGDAPKVQIAE